MKATRQIAGGAHAARGAMLLLTTAVATAVVPRLFWAAGSGALDAITATGPDAPADLLVLGACALGAAVTAWLGLTVLLATMAALPGAVGRGAGRVADRWAPGLVRRGVALALGTALVAGVPSLAHADTPRPGPMATQVAPAPAPDPAFTVTHQVPAVDGSGVLLPATTGSVASTAPTTSVPDPGFAVTTETAPPRRPPPSLGPLGPAPRPPASTASSGSTSSMSTTSSVVHVARGDTLWGIAARHLGAGASPSAIAREWPRWYAANRALIGADPDLIVVGQVLTAPPAGPTPGAPS